MEKLPDIQLPLLLGMKEVKIIGIKEDNGSLTITFQKNLGFGICPQCGTLSQKVKDRHLQPVTDRPIFENGTKLQIHKRRWKCVNDFCEVNTFTEEVKGLPRKYTHTELFYQEVYQLSRRMTYTGVYRHFQDARCKVALSTVYQRAQEQLRQKVTVPESVETRFIGLDEFSKGKEHDYGVVLVDLERNKIVDIADGGKTKKAAQRLLAKVDPQMVNACCIDMWKPFWYACRDVLPQALVVIDCFHVIKEVNEALDNVRKRTRKHLKSKEKKKALFDYKELLRMGLEKLTSKQEERLWELLSWNEDLSRAYELKELLRAIYAGEDAQKAAKELDSWIEEAKSSNIKEMSEVSDSLLHWRKEILNFWTYRISNGVTEGKINKIKTLRRGAYNYNNFNSLRLKILEQQ